MHLIELFLPLSDDRGEPFDNTLYAEVREELVDMFGGVTMFSRAPALGISLERGRRVYDKVIIAEVMTGELDRGWWADYRRALEGRFSQNEILVRATKIEQL